MRFSMTSTPTADLLISRGWVYPVIDSGTYYYPGSVVIRDGRIIAVGYSETIDSEWQVRSNLDATDHVVLPGLVNTHSHASNSLIRGLGGGMALEEWLYTVCWPIMSTATEEDLFAGVLLSALEMLQNGITTFADMWTGVSPA